MTALGFGLRDFGHCTLWFQPSLRLLSAGPILSILPSFSSSFHHSSFIILFILFILPILFPLLS